MTFGHHLILTNCSDLLERKAPRRARSEQTVHWKGLDWFVLLQFSQGTNKYNFGIFDMYVGYNAVPDDEKSHLKLYLQFQFVLLDEDGKEIATSSEIIFYRFLFPINSCLST